MANILITGGLGFIGSSLAHRLVPDGHRITVVDALLPMYGANPANIKGLDVELVSGDTRDRGLMMRAVKNKDIIIDCAAQVSHEISIKEPLLDFDINCNGAANIAEAWRREAPNAILIYAGTRGQKGTPLRTPVDETHPSNPPDFNGFGKQQAEDRYFFYSRMSERNRSFSSCILDARSILINNVYGERCSLRTDYGWVNKWIGMAIQNLPIEIRSDGTQTRDYTHIADVVEAFDAVIKKGSPREQYLIGSGEEVSIREIVMKIIKLSGSQGQVNFGPWDSARKSIEIGRYVVDSSKLQSLGWRAKVPLEEGLTRTIEFYRRNWEDYKP